MHLCVCVCWIGEGFGNTVVTGPCVTTAAHVFGAAHLIYGPKFLWKRRGWTEAPWVPPLLGSQVYLSGGKRFAR